MRSKIVAGNWKMNNSAKESKALIKNLKKSVKGLPLNNTRVIVAPSFVYLQKIAKKTAGTPIEVAAQNMNDAPKGAYTGEVSGEMLKSIHVNTVILGHSERREYYYETDTILKKKVQSALDQNFEIIFCFGEVLEDRKSNKHFDVVKSQIVNALFDLTSDDWENIILAYEPVWAIGTGETASPEQAQEMHAFVRDLIATKYDQHLAEHTSILYGGSVKPANAEEIFSKEDVDGGLIGGASLNADDFTAIVKAI